MWGRDGGEGGQRAKSGREVTCAFGAPVFIPLKEISGTVTEAEIAMSETLRLPLALCGQRCVGQFRHTALAGSGSADCIAVDR